MRSDPTSEARREFARSAASRRDQERFFRETEKKQKEDRVADRIDEDLTDLATIAVLATEAEVAAFRGDIDLYRTATTEALIENERQLVEVRRAIDDMLARAYVLPDGRRVFKTEDGLRVFDEHGVELSADTIDPEAIEEWRPRAEPYLDRRAAEARFVSEHEKLLDFEKKLDDADERGMSGDMTQDGMKALRDDLESSMPLAARRKLPGYEDTHVPDATRSFGAVSNPASGVSADLQLDLPQFGR
jgi:hypothetical protein